jgi:hypothetical protein
VKRYLRFEWEAIAGIIAAVAAIVLHFLHIVEPNVLLVIAVVLMAVLFARDLRKERVLERIVTAVEENRGNLAHLSQSLHPPDAVLVGPGRLRAVSEEFARRARGDMIWFHVCLLMFKPQALFDTLLKPAIENPKVRTIQFVLDENQRPLWEKEVAPKISACTGMQKVQEPRWGSIQENVSAVISEVTPEGTTEALLSFWGEPFMARTSGKDVPRYIFHVQGHSELVTRLLELERKYRLGR